MEEFEKRNITYDEYSNILNRLNEIEEHLDLNGNHGSYCDPNSKLGIIYNDITNNINKIYIIRTILSDLSDLLIKMCNDSDLNFITFKKLNTYLSEVQNIKSKLYSV